MKQLILNDGDSVTTVILKAMINSLHAELDYLKNTASKMNIENWDVTVDIEKTQVKIDSLVGMLQRHLKKADLHWEEIDTQDLVMKNWKVWSSKDSSCFGSKPGPQAQAENGCENCDDQNECRRFSRRGDDRGRCR